MGMVHGTKWALGGGTAAVLCGASRKRGEQRAESGISREGCWGDGGLGLASEGRSCRNNSHSHGWNDVLAHTSSQVTLTPTL